ncbi:MAG: transposase [Deltaproteobacteria bacterium]
MDVPNIDDLLKHPYVQELHQIIYQQHLDIEALKVELRKLKTLPAKPVIKPSKLDEPQEDSSEDKTTRENSETKPKRPGSEKRSKTKELVIHETKKLCVENIGQDWKFLHCEDYIVQNLIIKVHNTCYQREVWLTPEGKHVIAPLPAELKGTHYAPELQSYIVQQYHQCQVTQPLLIEELHEYGVDISVGQIDIILTRNKEVFHEEAKEILLTGLKISPEIRTDDTSAPHKGESGYCNCINTDYFTYFKSSNTKSRINFLEILSGDYLLYVLNKETISELRSDNLGKKYLSALENQPEQTFKDTTQWDTFLFDKGIVTDKNPQIYKQITEAALIQGLIVNGFNTDIIVHSDDAGQFRLFIHSLCWKHVERPLLKIICYTDYQRQILDQRLKDFWGLYKDLKLYKLNPTLFDKQVLSKRFDTITEPIKEGFAHLNSILEKIAAKKAELLLVLDRPETSLHNNASENDIREFAKRRKISGPTRSEAGRQARDTFASLKKTCRKLGVSFWEFLLDRISQKNEIPKLATIISEKYAEKFPMLRAR